MNITIDYSKASGRIKAMHAVGQPPINGAIGCEYFHYLTDAAIPYARLHDVGGPFAGNRWVDIPNIFRDFDADETKEESYDFAFTDLLIKELVDNGCAPYFRLGVTIENYHYIKAYRIYPPADYEKWARICEHIIRHYNEGWANGFFYGIRYWEIWNEPDNGVTPEENQMWKGTPEEYYELYAVTAKHLKACFGDSIMVGGFGSSGVGYALSVPEKYELDIPRSEPPTYCCERGAFMVEFFENFLAYIQAKLAPLDFFTWHAYGLNAIQIGHCSKYIDKMLETFGYADAENHLNEWAIDPPWETRGTVKASALCAATMCIMQDASTDILCIYDARIGLSMYGGVFCPYPEVKPFPLYFALKAFGELYRLQGWVKPEYTENEAVFAQAATDGEKKAFLITNISEEAQTIKTNLDKDMKAYLIDATHELTPVSLNLSEFVMQAEDVILWKNFE